jgi:primary-amine oxidase
MKSATVFRVLSFLLLVCGTHPAAAQTAKHPLDSLTAPEYWVIFDVMKASGHVDAKTRYPLIQLREPPKSEVLQWKPGQPFRREASLTVKQGPQTFEAVVDLIARKLISWNEVQGVQPNMMDEETLAPDEVVKRNPEWQAAMRRRGITEYSSVNCLGNSPGDFIAPEQRGRRILNVICFDRRGVWDIDSRPIAGLTVEWDVNEQKVLRVIDVGVVPVPTAPFNYDSASVGPLRELPTPITIEQPLGPSFQLNGHEVSWQKWNFHFRMDRRVGLVLSNVRYADGDKLRSVLYEGSLSEMFAPYMDPTPDWYYISYFDAGELDDGFPSSLQPGSDCPENSVYFDEVYATERGMPQLSPRSVCMFERSSGDPAWRHVNRGDPLESRKRRDLVLRTICACGTYDFIFDWVFMQDGTIRVAVGATGIDEVKAVTPRTAAEEHDGSADAYGRFVAENTVAVDHDHYFSFRLDLDIDGTANSFLRDRLQVENQPPGSPRKSVWVAKPEVVHTEQQGKLRMSMEHPEIWRIINPNVKSPMGYNVGYEIMPGENAMSIVSPDQSPLRRAGYVDYQLWVTPYRDNERYAAGDYPVQSTGGDGLPSWTKANRPVENTDIVVWYTMGFHHVPHSEDWPVMPTLWHEFSLRPVNFFARNPAIDLPK